MRRSANLCSAFVTFGLSLGSIDDVREAPVGITARIDELVLPGSKLEARPLELHDPIVLRIRHVYAHGADFRYDLEWYGLEPGEHDLRDFLQRIDGSASAELPTLPVTISSQLPPGQIEPQPLASKEVRGLGGYRLWQILVGALWLVGLFLWIFVGRRKSATAREVDGARPQTLAERLRPLVQRAMDGSLSNRERAELEMALYTYWRRRLGLVDRPVTEAIGELRAHAEAGPLLRALEEWLHRPGTARSPDLDRLLAPYREVSADAFDAAPAPAGAH